MKKLFVLLLALLLVTSLVACGEKNEKFEGTWKVESIEYEGSKFSINELKKSTNEDLKSLYEDLKDFYLILKDGGEAYLYVDGSGDSGDWLKSDNNDSIIIGAQKCEIVDKMICLDFDGNKVYLKKSSNSQEIPDEDSEDASTDISSENKSDIIEIKPSPDKYTWYIKNYVGKNCASFGDTWGSRYDKYGKAKVNFVFVTEDGSFVDPWDDESLKQYVVTAQSIKPNTELKLVFKTNDDGTEGDTMASQNIEENELYVKRIAQE